MRVEEIMKRDVKVCGQDDNLNSAAKLMWDNNCGCVPVVAFDGVAEIVAMITDRDICMAAYTQGKPLCEIATRSAMATKVLSCKPTDNLLTAEAIMREARIRRVPVVDSNGEIQGIVSLSDIARTAVAMRGQQGGGILPDRGCPHARSDLRTARPQKGTDDAGRLKMHLSSTCLGTTFRQGRGRLGG